MFLSKSIDNDIHNDNPEIILALKENTLIIPQQQTSTGIVTKRISKNFVLI